MIKFNELFVEQGLSMERLWVLEKVAAADCSLIKAADYDDGRAAQYSRQITELKKFFGANLINKQGRTLHLTRDGEELVAILRETFLRLADFKARCAQKPKEFSIGAGDSLLHWLVIPRLAKLGKAAKGYSFSLHNLQNAEIFNGLRDMTLDFGLARMSEAVEPLTRIRLGVKTYALFIPKDLLRKRPKSDWRTLLQQLPLVCQSQHTRFQREFEKRAAAAEIGLAIRLYCETVPEVVRALSTGRYAAVLHGLAAHELDPSKFHEVDLPLLDDLAPQIALVWNPGLLAIRGEAAETLKGLLSEKLNFSKDEPATSQAKTSRKRK